jgi:NAD(P) transhydrogenase subunit alpha
MKVAVLTERLSGENRVAASPDTVKKLIALGASVTVEKGAGEGASFTDAAYQDAGAAIAATALDAVVGAAVVLKVRGPEGSETFLNDLAEGTILIGNLAPYDRRAQLETYAAKKLSTFALELIPRITRAQTMDVLSSQSNLAGYRAVIEAGSVFGRAFPMMMTAAGTVAPARVVVLGAGVAGLQAIATARRLGAVVSAFDVRAAAKEQVESLGATFIAVEGAENAETKGGYAKEVSEDFKQRQQAKIHETLKKNDIVISTALIPGKPAPVLVTEEMVRDMKTGSVIVDLAAERGGNCTLTEPDKVVVKHGVSIIGYTNMPGRIAVDASALYARNVLNFLSLLIDKDTKTIKINPDDEIIKGTLLTHDGAVVHPAFAPVAVTPAATPTEGPAA